MPARLNHERWRALIPHLDRLLDLPVAERAGWLAALALDDPELARDLGQVLRDRDQLVEHGFLEKPLTLPVQRPSLAGQALGAYTLRTPIGHGGMGSVWRAERTDGRFEGVVAVKLLNAGLVGRDGEERFRREGSILARLQHPHIAHLLDAGLSPQGQPYLVLEHVQGERIDSWCDARRLDVEARLRLFLDVLAAVSHAHAHLVVHRDLKPSNVLVDSAGRVKLLDFGIAKLLEGEAAVPTTLTRDGESPMTPEYAAPEQLTAGSVSTATDVYALGALLYVLLTGRHPASENARSPAELVRAIVDTEPSRPSEAAATGPRADERATTRATTPRRLRGLLRGDLDNIVAMALKKRPDERYASAEAMAADLRRFMAHEPVSARPDSLRYRAARFARRNRTAVALASVAVIALVAGLAGTLSQARRARAQAARADQEARAAEEQRDFALHQLSRAEAINELNTFLLTEGAPRGRPFTAGELLTRAEGIVGQGEDPGGNRVDLLVSIGHLYDRIDRSADARRVLERAYEESRASTDPSTRARAACALAPALATAGKRERAEELFQQGLQGLPDQPQYALHRLFCLNLGSRIAGLRGDGKTAVARAEDSLRLARESRFKSPLVELDTLALLASAHQRAARYREAADVYGECIRRLEALGRGQTQGMASLLNNRGLALRGLGRPLEAEPLLRRSLDLGAAEEGASATKLVNMAIVLQELERSDEAAGFAERAEAQARRTGQDVTLGHALIARAGHYRQAGDLARLDRTIEELRALFQRIYPPGHGAFASLASQESGLAQARGDARGAVAAADRAVALAEEGRDGLFLPRALLRRSEVALESGRPDQALVDARRTLRLQEERVGPATLSSHLGLAHLAAARALQAQRRAGEAASAFAAALEHLEPTLGPKHSATLAARAR